MYHPPFIFTDEHFFSALEEGKSVNEMATLFGVNRSSIYKRIRKYNIAVPFEKTLLFNEHVFDCIDTEEKAYWLGFLYADGCVIYKHKRYCMELSLKDSDINHLWKFNDFLGFPRTLSKVKIGNVRCGEKICRRCRLAVSNKYLCSVLKKYGCVPQKSLILQFPNMNIFSNNALVFDFIRGYFDGDGCIKVLGKRVATLYLSVLGTKEFLTKMLSIIGSPEHTYHIYQKYPHKNTYSVEWKTEESKRVAELLYKDAKINLDRKYAKYEFAVSHSNMRYDHRVKTVKAETC